MPFLTKKYLFNKFFIFYILLKIEKNLINEWSKNIKKIIFSSPEFTKDRIKIIVKSKNF